MSARPLRNKWRTVKLNDLVTFKNGINFTKEQKGQCGIATVDVRNMYAPGIVLETNNLYDVALEVSPDYILEAGDVLIVRSSVKREGVGWPVLFQEAARPTTYCGFIIRARPKIAEINPKYLTYYLRSSTAREEVVSSSSQVTITNVNQRTLGSLLIPFPPLSEQRRIVAEIEKQFTRLEAGVAALRRVQANLKRYRASVLKAACEGRLVPTEAELARAQPSTKDSETGEALLARILTTRRREWQGRGKYKEPAAPDTTNLPVIPENWTWANLDQLLQNITDGDHLPPPQTDSGIPFLVIGNVRTGKLSFEETRFVARNYYDAIDPYRKPRKGDILYSLVGSYGIGLPVDTEREFCIQRHISVMRPHSLSPSAYLVHALNSWFVFQQATAAATGTAQKTVPLAGLRRFTIPLPPSAEQTRIVAEVERRLSVVEELEAVVSANVQRAARLRQSILQKAFSGSL